MNEWEKYGIYEHKFFLGFIYNSTSETIIAQFQKDKEDYSKTLYYRRLNENVFNKIPTDIMGSQERPIRVPNKPYIYYNQMKSVSDWGLNWQSIVKFNLDSSLSTNVFCTDDFEVSKPYVRGWVYQPLAISDNAHAETLDVIVGLELQKSADSTNVEYWLAEIDLGKKKHCLKSKLIGAGF